MKHVYLNVHPLACTCSFHTCSSFVTKSQLWNSRSLLFRASRFFLSISLTRCCRISPIPYRSVRPRRCRVTSKCCYGIQGAMRSLSDLWPSLFGLAWSSSRRSQQLTDSTDLKQANVFKTTETPAPSCVIIAESPQLHRGNVLKTQSITVVYVFGFTPNKKLPQHFCSMWR